MTNHAKPPPDNLYDCFFQNGLAPYQKLLPEWIELYNLLSEYKGDDLKYYPLGQAPTDSNNGGSFPLVGFSIGNQDPQAPVFALAAGVHGLERIGMQTLIALLSTLLEKSKWDTMRIELLKKVRIAFIPFVNPHGLAHLTRSNFNGVDLMRNAPVEVTQTSYPFYGGQSLTPKLPWFRGNPLQLEPESQALIDFCKKTFFESNQIIAIDFHSGFGVQDRLWFPYASQKIPFECFSEVTAFFDLFEKSHPHHFYQIEPTSTQYLIAGDLWDYIFKLYKAQNPDGVFLPITLEMGSWIWVRKNPLQVFSRTGLFHPFKTHRQKRVLRRHWTLFDFAQRALLSPSLWADLNMKQKEHFWQLGLNRWYR